MRTKFLVVGGGPAGSIAARSLARAGTETLLIERDLSFVKPCGGGVPSSAFSELGLPSLPSMRLIDSLRLISPSGETVPIRLTGASIAIVSRGEFDAALRADAARAGARIMEAEFLRFVSLGKTVVVEARAAGSAIAIEADYVIAADGVNSRVRQALGMKPAMSFMTIAAKTTAVDAESCEFWFGSSHAPRLYSWVFPQKAGVSAGTGTFHPREITGLWRRFAQRRHIPEESAGLRGYRIPFWQGDLYCRDRILFAGDAAGQVLPLTAEGIYYAMRSGDLAARALIDGTWKGYRRLWEREFGKRFALMRRLWEYFLKDDSRAEQLVALHKRPDVQEASMRLWLRKDRGGGSLRSYISLFRKIIS